MRAAIPNFQWDLSERWNVRVKKALDHRADPLYLHGILAVETDAVRKHIQAALQAK